MAGDIWLGDAATAIEALATGEADRQAILRLLGLAPAPRAEIPIAARPRPAVGPARPVDSEPGLAVPPAEPAELRGAEPVVAAPRLLTPVAFEPPAASRSPEPLPRADRTRLRALRPHEPLLAPSSTRALLGAALSRPVPEGEIDLAAVVEAVAHGRPVGALPRSRVWTLRYGVQVLVDLGTGMRPFARDQLDLVTRLRRLFGPERIDVQQFAYAPLRGTGPGPRWTWGPYRPPPPETRILVLSDFGIGGPVLDYQRGERAEWEEFADVLTRHGRTAVGFVPYPPGRWPSWLDTRLRLVCWDRGTTVAAVRSRVR